MLLFICPRFLVKDREHAWKISQAVLVGMQSIYRFESLKSKPEENKTRLRKVTLNITQNSQLVTSKQAIQHGQAIAHGMNVAKDLGNLAPNICTPTYLAKQSPEHGENTQVES